MEKKYNERREPENGSCYGFILFELKTFFFFKDIFGWCSFCVNSLISVPFYLPMVQFSVMHQCSTKESTCAVLCVCLFSFFLFFLFCPSFLFVFLSVYGNVNSSIGAFPLEVFVGEKIIL